MFYYIRGKRVETQRKESRDPTGREKRPKGKERIVHGEK